MSLRRSRLFFVFPCAIWQHSAQERIHGVMSTADLNSSLFQCEVLFTPLSRCLAPRWRSALQWYIRNKMGVVESRNSDATCFWCRPNDFIWD
ncbi:unnamed protein product [Leuciscus chuanchicus]